MELMDGPLLLEEHFNDNVPFNGASYNTLLSTSSTQKETSYHHRRQDKKLKYNAVIQRIKKLTRSQSQNRINSLTSSTNTTDHIVLRTRNFCKDVKRRFSSPHSPQQFAESIETDNCETSSADIKTGVPVTGLPEDGIYTTIVKLRRCSSNESLPSDSGCGSSIKTCSLSTDSNRSSICTVDEANVFNGAQFRGPFIGKAKALVNCTPCPYDKDALAFKKDDVVDIIAKNDSGTWIGIIDFTAAFIKAFILKLGMTNSKVGHFKFINVEEIKKERGHKLSKLNPEQVSRDENLFTGIHNKNASFKLLKDTLKSGDGELTLEELFNILGLEETGYVNILRENSIQDLESFVKVGQPCIINILAISNLEHETIITKTIEIVEKFLAKKANEVHDDVHNSRSSQINSEISKKSKSIAHSAPVTPAFDFTYEHFTDWFDKLNVLTSPSPINHDIGTFNKKIRNKGNLGKDSSVIKEVIKSNSNEKEQFKQKLQLKLNYFKKGQPFEGSSENEVKEIELFKRLSICNPEEQNFHKDAQKLISRAAFQKKISELSYKNKGSISLSGKSNITSSWSVFDLRGSTRTNDLHPMNTRRRIKRLLTHEKKGLSLDQPDHYKSSTTLNGLSKPLSPSLLEDVNKRLNEENIDLSLEPYSDSTGFCGIPPALVQRYAEEIQNDIYDVADALDHLRLAALFQKGKNGIPNDFLADSCVGTTVDNASYEDLRAWLASIGLPMYLRSFNDMGCTKLSEVLELREPKLIEAGITNRSHLRTLVNCIGALNVNLKKSTKQRYSIQ